MVRKSFYLTALLVTVALGTLLLLAFNQFHLYGRHELIIAQTEKVLFQYSNIREQIVEDMVEGRAAKLTALSPAVEELHNNLIKILDNQLIPAEYKFSFLQQIDLPGLVLLLRRTADEGDNGNLLRRINEESRIIGERFVLFERLVLNHAKQRLVDFQSIVIGILALVVFLVTVLLLVTYRFLISPVMQLAEQSGRLVSGRMEQIEPTGGWEEVAELAGKLNLLAAERDQNRALTLRYESVSRCMQQTVHRVLETTDRESLFRAVCRSVLGNRDYVLAWIGINDPDGREIMPVVVDGSSTMSCDECQECFSALLAAQEGVEPAMQAFAGGEPVVMKDVLAEAPKGPFKKTVLAEGRVDSISLPLRFNGSRFGVLTIYSKVSGDIAAAEVELLGDMAALVAGKAQSLEEKSRMNRLRQERNIVGEQTEILSFTLDRDGMIVAAEPYLAGSVYEQALAHCIGAEIMDIVLAENESGQLVFRESINRAARYDFTAKLAGFDTIFSASLVPLNNIPAEQELLLLILVAPQKHLLLQPENFRIAYSAAIGRFAGTIAHEITNMCNGIINYAQILSDEPAGSPSDRKQSLERIIREGEKVAAIVEPLLIDQDDLEFTRNMETIEHIFAEVLRLVDPCLKRDCIAVTLSVEPSSLTFKKQHVQLILFDLLGRLGGLINTACPNKDENKVLDISALPLLEEGKKMLQIDFRFPVSGNLALDSVLRDGSGSGMWLSQELARALGGEVSVADAGSGKGRIELLLPA